eukprot:Nitzschia sp. Nitz4//scaffold122_size67431//48282//48955//NITZ4_006091-RA/size67431-processed-gene-0.67-mRNA-1//-1//CDS//3329534421//3198//frame0
MCFKSFFAASLVVATASGFAITPGMTIPNLDLHQGFPPKHVNLPKHCAGRTLAIVPGYLESQGALKAAGIEEILVYCVNDGAVMKAWSRDQGTDGTMVNMMADPSGEFTKAIGMELTHEGPISVGIIGRCKRFAMIVADGVVKAVNVAESEFDPAGDDFPEKTLAPALIDMAKSLN